MEENHLSLKLMETGNSVDAEPGSQRCDPISSALQALEQIIHSAAIQEEWNVARKTDKLGKGE